MTKKTYVLIGILLFAAIFIFTQHNWRKGDTAIHPMKIGQMSGLTGDGSDIGTDEADGAILAVEQINATGGISGRPLQLISEDTPPFDLKKGASVAEKLTSVDQVAAIVGPQWDSQGELMAAFSGSHKIPVISQNVSTDIESKINSPYFFVTWPDDEVGIKQVLQYAQSKGWKKIAIIEPANFSFWLFTANLMKKNAPAYGIQIVDTEMGTDFGNVDYRTLISKTKSSNPDAVFGSYTDLECTFLKQMKEQGMNVPFLSTDSAGSPKALTECPSLLEGKLFYATMSKKNGYDEFAKAFKVRFGQKPISPSAATAYNAVQVLAQVLKQLSASNTPVTRDAIANGLRSADLKGAVSIGEIRFNEKGYVITPPDAYEMRTVKEGEFVKAE